MLIHLSGALVEVWQIDPAGSQRIPTPCAAPGDLILDGVLWGLSGDEGGPEDIALTGCRLEDGAQLTAPTPPRLFEQVSEYTDATDYEAIAVDGHPGVIWQDAGVMWWDGDAWQAHELPWFLGLGSWAAMPDGRLLLSIQNVNDALDGHVANFAVLDPTAGTLDPGEIVCRLWSGFPGQLLAGEGWAVVDGQETVPFTLE